MFSKKVTEINSHRCKPTLYLPKQKLKIEQKFIFYKT
jgi:hypothetical protein